MQIRNFQFSISDLLLNLNNYLVCSTKYSIKIIIISAQINCIIKARTLKSELNAHDDETLNKFSFPYCEMGLNFIYCESSLGKDSQLCSS